MQPWIDWTEWDAAADQAEKEILGLRTAAHLAKLTCLAGVAKHEHSRTQAEDASNAVSGCRDIVERMVIGRTRELRRASTARWSAVWHNRWLGFRGIWQWPARRK